MEGDQKSVFSFQPSLSYHLHATCKFLNNNFENNKHNDNASIYTKNEFNRPCDPEESLRHLVYIKLNIQLLTLLIF